jgi:cysteinyl-tRNA synthetase
MAKSKGNFMKLPDIEDAGISPIAFRYWLLTSHYRSQVNFTLDAVKASQTAFIRLIEIFVRLNEVKEGDEHIHAHGEPREYKTDFLNIINDDFNMPEAIALVWELIKDHSVEAKEKIKLLLDFDKVLGLGLQGVMDMKKTDEDENVIPDEIKALGDAREEARKNKEWDKADALRKEIESRGYEVKDTGNSFEIRKI